MLNNKILKKSQIKKLTKEKSKTSKKEKE